MVGNAGHESTRAGDAEGGGKEIFGELMIELFSFGAVYKKERS